MIRFSEYTGCDIEKLCNIYGQVFIKKHPQECIINNILDHRSVIQTFFKQGYDVCKTLLNSIEVIEKPISSSPVKLREITSVKTPDDEVKEKPSSSISTNHSDSIQNENKEIELSIIKSSFISSIIPKEICIIFLLFSK